MYARELTAGESRGSLLEPGWDWDVRDACTSVAVMTKAGHANMTTTKR
jgi:hypothetical protein